jgi:hypothetical protein
MNPPGKTTLARMQRATMLEAERIEISQDFWVRDGRLKEAEPHMVERRDDFAGVVRLIDTIMSDKVLLDRLQERMAAAAAPATVPIDPDKEVAVDVEIGAE